MPLYIYIFFGCFTHIFDCLPVEIFQRYQLNFTTLLCLKKSICESAF